MTEETQPATEPSDARFTDLTSPGTQGQPAGAEPASQVFSGPAPGHQPRYAITGQALLPGLAAKAVLAVVIVVAVIGAALTYLLGTMYGFTVDAARRTDQWLSVLVCYAACGGFLAFPCYLVGLYSGNRKWYTIAAAVLGGVTLLLLILWWI
ncbi:MAG: hypothetical protein Q4B08_06845 [Propionibacteriaceae bacterium]|nr:hypothetical protein [Propionibacteriaceae bacterium]